jgi:hypothetical protein
MQIFYQDFLQCTEISHRETQLAKSIFYLYITDDPAMVLISVAHPNPGERKKMRNVHAMKSSLKGCHGA